MASSRTRSNVTKPHSSMLASPKTVPSLTLTSPSSLGSNNSILSDFSDSVTESNGLWSKGGQSGCNHTVASDTSVASVDVSFEQSKFDLNGDEVYSDFYDEIRSRSGTRKAARSMSLDSACPGQINIAPRQLADIFSIFNAMEDEKKQVAPQLSSLCQPEKAAVEKSLEYADSDAATEVTSNTFSPSSISYHPMVESLQRECDTLKQIINTDSTKMLQLQAERKKVLERLETCTSEKNDLKKQLDSLEAEKERILQREHTKDETIRRLKAELNKRPRDQIHTGSSIYDTEELRLANELLASQVVQAERELERLLSDNESEKENVPPPVTPNVHKSKHDWGVSSPYEAIKRMDTILVEESSPQTLALQIRNLESRLNALEEGSLSKFPKGRSPREQEDKSTQVDRNLEAEILDGCSISLEGIGVEGIEVGLDGSMSVAAVEPDNTISPPKTQVHAQTGNDSPRKHSGDYFCDCFQTVPNSDKEE